MNLQTLTFNSTIYMLILIGKLIILMLTQKV
nr:MAG TPA: hypothetical protein [Caudoviricetes sp.]